MTVICILCFEVGMPDELENALDKSGETTRLAWRKEMLARRGAR